MDGLDLRLRLRGVRLLRMRMRFGGQILGVRHVVRLRLSMRRRRRFQALRLHSRLDRLARLHQACAVRGGVKELESRQWIVTARQPWLQHTGVMHAMCLLVGMSCNAGLCSARRPPHPQTMVDPGRDSAGGSRRTGKLRRVHGGDLLEAAGGLLGVGLRGGVRLRLDRQALRLDLRLGLRLRVRIGVRLRGMEPEDLQ